jgi:hypothetical protein
MRLASPGSVTAVLGQNAEGRDGTGGDEADPDTWQKPLQKSLVETGVDQDEEVLRQAQQVMKLVQPQQASQGKYHIQIGAGKGIVTGDNAQVTQTCGKDE